jgi:tRNA uridine 5-carboxymethylaminomethyl modification enzyme
LFAGANAALQCRAMAGLANDCGGAWTPGRDQAYLGVLVDDLTTKGVTEPYRMFTSRAEFRLQLREDNADMRLTEIGRHMGLVDDARWEAFSRKRDAVSRETERLKSVWVNPRNLPPAESERVLGKAIDHEHNLADLLRRPDVSYDALMSLDGGRYQSPELLVGLAGDDVSRETTRAVVEQVEIAAKYSGYIDRQRDEVQRAAHYENLKLPEDFDYNHVTALSIEVRQKLTRYRPETLGQASRVSGITPAAISLLLIHLKRARVKGFVPEVAAVEPSDVAAA